jgi:uncharacterized protein (DUF4415 family)
MQPEVGDKVRLKASGQAGRRGVIESVRRGTVIIRVGENERVSAAPADLTNYSLAARKAWQNMPDRKVGRPRGTRVCDRVSVTLRIDRELWEWFRRLEASGLVADRTSSINHWLRDKLTELDKVEPPQNGKKG